MTSNACVFNESLSVDFFSTGQTELFVVDTNEEICVCHKSQRHVPHRKEQDTQILQ